jgi:hypothetical protein
MKRLLAAAVLAFAPLTHAVAGALVDLSVRDLDTGAVLPEYLHRGQHWVPGTPGHRYAVTLRNNTGGRVLAVLSVDGVNAVTGQTASPNQSGYVLGPWEQVEIRGWRKSMSDVAEFYFTDLPDSYAARTGRPQNVGVIGAAVYTEAVRHYAPPPPIAQPEPYGYAEDRARNGAYAAEAPAAKPAPAAPSTRAGAARAAEKSAGSGYHPQPQRRQELGTGHGARRYDPATYTQFERASARPAEVVSIRYDDYDALVDRGVIHEPPRRHWHREPDPFPVGFVPDPY